MPNPIPRLAPVIIAVLSASEKGTMPDLLFNQFVE
jgi:hypothetical protein